MKDAPIFPNKFFFRNKQVWSLLPMTLPIPFSLKNFSCFFLLVFISCRSKVPAPKNDDARLQLMEVDRAFSKRSADAGLKTAYLEFIDSTAVLLRPGNMPLTGANAIDFICMNNDAGASMSWEPKGCNLSRSGDLGYTWGIYSLRTVPDDSVTYGTYVNVWKKQEDGSWKFMVNSGNQGVE